MIKLKKIVRWCLILGLGYLIISTLYFGYDDIDSEKGIYKFYWSGLKGLWDKERSFGFKKDEIVQTSLSGTDGPYVYENKYFYVDENNNFLEGKLDSLRKLIIKTSINQLPEFSVSLKDTIYNEIDSYEMPEKLIAISDIEGNFIGLFSFLLSNKIIDSNANWIFGKGHLVLNGDFVDRGSQVCQVLWLIYHLENQAIKAGGKVHFILGNHEIMNMYGDVSYNDFKYIEIAKRISKQNNWKSALINLYSKKSELGKWLRSKNIVERIGKLIFVHGGLNTLHQKGKYDINDLNTISRKYYGIEPTENFVKSKKDWVVINSIDAPFWDRRLNFDLQYRIVYMLNGISTTATTENELQEILEYYNVDKIIIGHSVVKDVETGYNNKVIKLDVKHGKSFKSGKTRGVLIINNIFYKVDDIGNMQAL